MIEEATPEVDSQVETSEIHVVFFIPGYSGGQSRGYSLRNLMIPGVRRASTETNAPVTIREVDSLAGCPGVVLSGQAATTYIYEIPWETDVQYLSSLTNPAKKLSRALTLCLFWAFSSVWRGLFTSPYMTFSLVGGIVVLIVWVLILFVPLINGIINFKYLTEEASHVPLLRGVASVLHLVEMPFIFASHRLRPFFTEAGWKFFKNALLAGFGFLTLITSWTDVSDLTRRYITHATDKDGREIDDVLQRVVAQAIDEIAFNHRNARFSIVGHSFGSMIALDVIANRRLQNLAAARLVTLGGFFQILAYRSNDILGAISRALNSPVLDSWTEYYSNRDLASARTQLDSNEHGLFKVRQLAVLRKVTILQSFTNRSHSLYFQDHHVFHSLTTFTAQ